MKKILIFIVAAVLLSLPFVSCKTFSTGVNFHADSILMYGVNGSNNLGINQK